MPLHAERRRVGSRAWSNRFTLLVGEGGFHRSIPPTNPVGFPLVLPTWREGGKPDPRPPLLSLCVVPPPVT